MDSHQGLTAEWSPRPSEELILQDLHESVRAEEGENNLAIDAQDEKFVEEALQDIEERFQENLHELLGYTVEVPVKISADDKLGIYLQHPLNPEKGLLLDETTVKDPPFQSTEVKRIDSLKAVGNWNQLQILGAEVDGYEGDLAQVIDPREGHEADDGPRHGQRVLLSAVIVDGRGMGQRFRKFYVGLEGVRFLQSLQQDPRYKNGEKARLTLCFFIQRTYSFHYKARRIRGNALHVLAVARRQQIKSADLIDMLFEEIYHSEHGWEFLHSECDFITGKNQLFGQCQALHLAAGRGNRAFMELLLDAGVDVNVKTRNDYKDNYTALHEAAFFKQADAVEFLLDNGAKVNETNFKRQTPLHIAATQGGYLICRLLVKYQADVHTKDNQKFTALDAAMANGRYPHHKLFHLTGRSFSDLLKVARHSPQAASDLLRDVQVDAIHPSWAESLGKEMIDSPEKGLSNWVALLGIAPKAGEEVIEALTVAPPVKDESHHPLPRRVSLPAGSQFLCQYQPEDTWMYYSAQNEVIPTWHRELCPGTETRFATKPLQRRTERWCRQVYGWTTGQGSARDNQVQQVPETNNALRMRVASNEVANQRGRQNVHQADLVPVKVVIVKLPGIICPMVMYVLSTVDDRHIFLKIGVRAIVEYVWTNLVQYQYYNKTAQRAVVIALLFCFVIQVIPTEQDSYLRRGAWSLVGTQVYHELFYETFEALGHCVELKLPEAYFWEKRWSIPFFGWSLPVPHLKNLFDYLSAALGLWVMHSSQHDLRIENQPVWLALMVMGRWVMFTWTCRAFAVFGEKILPVLQASCMPLVGILLVTLFVFAGFLHSFAALTLHQNTRTIFEVTMGTLRLLVLGDGDGAGVVLGLYDGDEELGSHITIFFFSVAVIAFCICLLNLFIAVHGEAYDKAQETAQVSFLQERAAICLNCLLMPKWPPPGWPRLPCCWKILNQRRLCCGIYALSFGAWGLLIWMRELHPWIASFTLLAGSLLADAVLLQLPWHKKDSQKYYFWVCHRDGYDEGSNCATESELPGRLSSVKHHAILQTRRVSEHLCHLKHRVDQRNQGLELHLMTLDQRLRLMEGRLAVANAALAGFLPPVME
ncbi:unnamed protein product [Durusdinium trenchii]|uniref:Ion transport domain-containing protein n=1 Tax=Durusdinium trenchii TaxID=1381693 RepID=A0ABP0SWW8_9DINO